MENFVSKQDLLLKEEKIKINWNSVGLVSWKFHSFLKPEENEELHKLGKICLDNAKKDNIGTVVEGLVLRNFMWDLDIEYSYGQYSINRDVDNDRKTHIIYGFGCLEGNIPKSVTVIIEKFDKGGQFQHKYEIKNDGYFHWFDPFIVVNRNDDVFINFESNESPYKIYGMTCEALGANMTG